MLYFILSNYLSNTLINFHTPGYLIFFLIIYVIYKQAANLLTTYPSDHSLTINSHHSSMPGRHNKIQRPISGGKPNEYCFRCGLTTRNTNFVRCSGNDPQCPNLLHRHCLNGDSFDCDSSGDDRVTNNDNIVVDSPPANVSTLSNHTINSSTTTTHLETITSAENGSNTELCTELEGKSRDDLIAIISHHRKELQQYKLIIKLTTSGNNLNKVRDSLTASLSFLDQFRQLTSTIHNSNRNTGETNSDTSLTRPGLDIVEGSEELNQVDNQHTNNSPPSNQDLTQPSDPGTDFPSQQSTQSSAHSPVDSPVHSPAP